MKKLCAMLLCFSMMFLTGCACWDEKEMNEIGIVTGIAIDKDAQTNHYQITLQVILPGNMQKNQENNKKPYKDISSEGDTFFSAQRKLSQKYERSPFYSHNGLIIVDEAVAREGMNNILDFFTRDIESRDNMLLAVAKDTKARDVLDYDNKTERIPSIALSKFDNVSFRNPGSVYKTLLDFNQSCYAYGMDPLLGIFSLTPEMNSLQTQTGTQSADGQQTDINYAGSAVFAFDKFQGFLSEDETTAYNFAAGKIKSAVVNVNGLQDQNSLITTQVLCEHSHIEPHFNGSEISFDINISDVSNIDEVHDDTDVTDIDVIAKLEEEHNEKVKALVEELLNKTQTEYKSDILGLGQSFYKKYPRQWEKIKNNWPEIYPTVRCNVIVKSTLVRTGMTNNKNKAEY
ncbi:Ger(x)C family spore germination protein [Ethanoligenens harbinense]|uniref:Germination protein, Ger(X)C family n=1 Tax=Ethanoligenens harbinense (strain DSM 18485 / JCM 12961 / CGMCC 1.5033 / YUAN-3) TaxID=663278 RepID=E6U6K8_ETHHY|nr:Ger(x)C family spore germination protein [Ethanoligenens harbinense]ADU28078.1 germination protein, Ger(x)C family [Ethanoligenens harbinense YUAN-3]AVQ97091.1 Ger(x)C family spore germination protein [Ethanoligenens harbinense YUAN-3]AYF39753.1 Ger(x)C family spore germination protein [Ethanoligenens harbinense]AYF42586.1 Ger(x)C family spore germination protein [Ethanoligenens harbinense]QCN93334.1 Ger(x)C family spore germination protein [Ethanoligenens harbinense]